MESVRKAHHRIRKYPKLLAECSKSAAVYAACVTQDLNVKHKICEKEFIDFKNCLQQAARKMNTKL